jgi:hypothetical protein
MSIQDIKEDIKIIDMKIQRAEQVIQEKKLKVERLQHKRGKLITKLSNKATPAEGLLERFTVNMVLAKGKSGTPSTDPSTSGELKSLSKRRTILSTLSILPSRLVMS